MFTLRQQGDVIEEQYEQNVECNGQQKKKKIWNRVDCQCSEKGSKTHKRLKEHFLIGRNRTKCAHFWGSPLFQATYNTEKQTIQLILCQLDVGGWQKEKGTRLQLKSVLLISCSCVLWKCNGIKQVQERGTFFLVFFVGPGCKPKKKKENSLQYSFQISD